MNDKEKLEMIAMCARAKAEGKNLQFYNVDEWEDSTGDIFSVINAILAHGFKYRVKPGPKTMRYRNYFIRYDTGLMAVDVAYNDYIEHVDKNPGFVSWADIEREVELPE